jgi:hypothetical protein
VLPSGNLIGWKSAYRQVLQTVCGSQPFCTGRPQRYLTSVLAKIGTTPTGELDQFLPDVWKAKDTAEPISAHD